MIDVEPVIREELERRVPGVDPGLASWPDILRRSGETRLRRRRRLAVTMISSAAVVALALSPLGGAVTRAVGGFSDWLRGTPGAATPPAVQQRFDAADFPGSPRLHELLRTSNHGRRFVLYGFATRQVVCLRLARAFGTGPDTACVSRAELRRTHDLVLPVKANLTIWHVGRRGRSAHKRPPTPVYVVTFGLAAHQVTSVSVATDRGARRAVLQHGAFLQVIRADHGNVWARTVIARTAFRRTVNVQLSVEALGQRRLHTGLRPHGPSRVTRTVTGGTIDWFVRRESRGLSPQQAHFSMRGCCHGYTRLIQPDPGDFLLMLVSDHRPVPIPRSHHIPILTPKPKPGEHRICLGAVTHVGVGFGCTTVERLFRKGPLALSWGFSGAGQQFWLVQGLASDDVTRIEVFLGTGEQWRAPLRDNATLFRVQRAKFPVRIVAYDAGGRIVAVQTIRG